jgi:polyisoprenoid-binding protein YceI
MKKLIAFFLFAFIALTSINATSPKPTTYKVDVAKSTFKWTGKKVAGEHWGYIKFAGGQLTADNNAVTGGNLTVDMNSIDDQDIQGEWAAKLVGHLKADDFFGTEKFPTSTITVKSVTSKGGNEYDVKADLTIKGITNEISFPATITTSANEVTTKASFKVDRTKYGIKYGSSSFFENLQDKAISNEFMVDVNLVATVDAMTTAAPATKVVKEAKATKKSKKKKAAKTTEK